MLKHPINIFKNISKHKFAFSITQKFENHNKSILKSLPKHSYSISHPQQNQFQNTPKRPYRVSEKKKKKNQLSPVFALNHGKSKKETIFACNSSALQIAQTLGGLRESR